MSVAAALAEVMAELPSIGKDDRSPEGYQYRGIEQITRHLQPLLAKHGVVIVPSATVTEVVPSPAMKDGWQDVHMRVEWTIYGPDGDHITAATTGIGRDRSDKGANKAQTQAYKYLLLHLFCIADGKDDSDGQTYEQDRAAPVELASDEQVAEFEDLLGGLDDGRKDQLKEWFRANRVPRIEKASAVQAAGAIAEAGRLASQVSGGDGGPQTTTGCGLPEDLPSPPDHNEAVS